MASMGIFTAMMYREHLHDVVLAKAKVLNPYMSDDELKKVSVPLGLWRCLRFYGSCGGSIWVYGAPYRSSGTTVFLTVPEDHGAGGTSWLWFWAMGNAFESPR